ncbi:MAG: PAS domain S-box-containing protein, partial [Mariniblastus sp.]
MDPRESASTDFVEKQTQQLADLIPSMVWTCLADGYADYFNQRWYEQTGLTPEASMGLGWADTLHPDDRERVMCEWQSAVETGDDYEIELRHRMANGRYRWHLTRAITVRDEAGDIDHWFGVSTDIDEKHESEEVAKAMTRAIVEADSNAIFTVNDHGIIQFQNLAAADMFGYEPSSLLERNIKKLLPKYFREGEKDFLAKHFQPGQRRTIKGDVCGRRKDGSTFPLELTVQEVSIRGKPMYAVVIRDATDNVRLENERIQSQQDLEREKAFLETIFNGLPDALMFASLGRKLTHCNDAAYQMFGYSAEEFIGHSVSVLYATPQEHRRQGNERFNKNAMEQLDVIEIEWRRKNGETFTGETVGTVIRDIAGEPLGFLKMIRDVTERKLSKEVAL